MSKKKKQDAIRDKLNRKGITLIALLAILILVINIVSFSYSWFEPQTEKGKGLGFNNTTSLRSEECDFETFIGSVVTSADKTGSQAESYKGYYIDQIKYNETKATGSVKIPKATTANGVTTPGRTYFRTDITNASKSYSSVVSLYAHSMPANLTVACTVPSNSVRAVGSAAVSDYYIIRNAYVKIKDDNDADGPGLLRVEWFLENSTSSDIYIDLSGLYLMYN